MFNTRLFFTIVTLLAVLSVMSAFGLTLLKKYGDPLYADKFVIGPRPNPQQDYSVIDADPHWHRDQFEVQPGVLLQGVVRVPQQPSESTPWLLLFHSNGKVELSAYPELLRALVGDEDWGFAMWCYRGYGPSGGVSTKSTLRADSVEMAYRVMNQWQVSPQQLRIFGFSLGTAPAAHAAMVLSQEGRSAAGVVLAATGYRPGFPASLVFDPMSEVSRRDAIESPMMIVHGTQDGSHRVENAVADFLSLKKADAEMLLVQSGHYPLGAPHIKKRLREFFRFPETRR